RSPAAHVSDKTCPILLLQGLDDPVVPPAQSRAIAAQLRAHGIRHALLEFEGESHGFRCTETIIKCLEAELSFYAQILGFTPPGIPAIPLVTHEPEPTSRPPAPSEQAGEAASTGETNATDEAHGNSPAEVPANPKR